MSTAARGFQNLSEPLAVTILNGASLSDAANLVGKTLVGVLIPALWTAAAVTFAVNHDGGTTFYPMYDQYAEASVVSSIVATAEARYFAVDPTKFLGVRSIKVRSGINGTAVNQGADRVLTLIVRAV